MDSKDQNLDLTRTKQIHFCLFQNKFISVYFNPFSFAEYPQILGNTLKK